MTVESTSLMKFQTESDGRYAVATLEYPGSLDETDKAVILAPGLGSPELAGLRTCLAHLGHAAVSFEQPRAALGHWCGNVGEVRAGTILDIAKKVERYAGIGNITLGLHSLASFDGVLAVPRMAEEGATVASVEFVAGAGFTGERFFATAGRLGHSGIAEITGGYARGAAEVAYNVLRNPLQIVAEGIYGSRSDICSQVEKLSTDIDLGLLQFQNDHVFPVNTVDVRTAGINMRRTTTSYPKHACHISPLHDPQRTAEVFSQVLADRDR